MCHIRVTFELMWIYVLPSTVSLITGAKANAKIFMSVVHLKEMTLSFGEQISVTESCQISVPRQVGALEREQDSNAGEARVVEDK